MSAVCNATPLVVFARVERFDRLQAVFGRLLVPEAVFREVIVHGAGRPGAIELASASWIEFRRLRNALPSDLRAIGVGEAEVIALAIELGIDTVVLDDRQGRAVAARRGLVAIGSAGVLVRAKRRGIVELVEPLLGALHAAGLYLSSEARANALRAAGELP